MTSSRQAKTTKVSESTVDIDLAPTPQSLALEFQLPDPEDDNITIHHFQEQVSAAWQVCDRFDLQTDIWRGRILRVVRDREKCQGEGRGASFLKWLTEQEISKSQAYRWIEMANSADTLMEAGHLDLETVEQFSKRAFVETAQAPLEVQEMVSAAASSGDQITRRVVRNLADEWTAMTSDLLPEIVKEKAAEQTIPMRYLAPLVREMEKLPEIHQDSLREAIAENPDIDSLKQITSDARRLAKYLETTTQVQALNQTDLDLEAALDEALRLDCLNFAADVVSQAAQLEQLTVKLYSTWKRLNGLMDRLYVESGASTPNLRSLLECLGSLSSETIHVQFGQLEAGRLIRLQIEDEEAWTATVEEV